MSRVSFTQSGAQRGESNNRQVNRYNGSAPDRASNIDHSGRPRQHGGPTVRPVLLRPVMNQRQRHLFRSWITAAHTQKRIETVHGLA